jgi:hypothetical protein
VSCVNFRADFTKNKVGMEYEELTAAARYVDSEHGEPISSMKQAGVESCELCVCAPCQCGKMRKTGGPSNDPFEVRCQACVGWLRVQSAKLRGVGWCELCARYMLRAVRVLSLPVRQDTQDCRVQQ